MALKSWHGAELFAKAQRASVAAIDATMAACILEAKTQHGAGAHALARFETQTGELERSVRIVQAARAQGKKVSGQWGSVGLAYARRIEFGFQGQDSAGRVVDAPAYPFLFPAAESQYPRLAGRIVRAFGGA